MATLGDVFAGLRLQLQNAIDLDAVEVTIGRGEYAPQTLTDLGKGADNRVLISMSDHTMGKPKVPYISKVQNQTLTPCQITATMDNPAGISPGNSVHITITLATYVDGNGDTQTYATPIAQDAAALAVSFRAGGFPVQDGASFTLTSDGTLEDIATGLAASINARETINAYLSATASGAVVTITNNSDIDMNANATAGNGGWLYTLVGRTARNFQIKIRAKTQVLLDAVCDQVEVLMNGLAFNFGFTLTDGSMARFELQGDFEMFDDALKNHYRRDFVATVTYDVFQKDQLWSYLIPAATIN